MLLALLKWILVLALLTAGAFFLAVGCGIAIPMVKYKGFEAHNLPTGAALLIVGLLLAIFWKVSSEVKTTTKQGKYGPTTIREHKTVFFRNKWP